MNIEPILRKLAEANEEAEAASQAPHGDMTEYAEGYAYGFAAGLEWVLQHLPGEPA